MFNYNLFTDTKAYNSYEEHKQHTTVVKDFYMFSYVFLFVFQFICVHSMYYFDLLAHHNYNHQHYTHYHTEMKKNKQLAQTHFEKPKNLANFAK